jgi:type IV fimbrial biogenesis protein FimT
MFSKKIGKTNQKGITLIELVVVFVIIAICAVLIAPNIGGWLPNYRIRSAIRDVISTMRTAQMKAVSQNVEYQVSFNVAERSYILQRNTGTTAAPVWVDEGVRQTLPTGITIPDSSMTFPGKSAQFNPNSTSSTGSMTLENTKGTKKRITLTTATGKVTLTED